jgi:hypothetical protein
LHISSTETSLSSATHGNTSGTVSGQTTIDVPFSAEHVVVGDTMLRFDHTKATCCGRPIRGESLWPLSLSNDGINWVEVGMISGHDVHALLLRSGSSFWIYGPAIGGGSSNIEVLHGTTLGISTDGQIWQEIDIPQGINEKFQRCCGFVHVAGEAIFIFYGSGEGHDADQMWVGTVETN